MKQIIKLSILKNSLYVLLLLNGISGFAQEKRFEYFFDKDSVYEESFFKMSYEKIFFPVVKEKDSLIDDIDYSLFSFGATEKTKIWIGVEKSCIYLLENGSFKKSNNICNSEAETFVFGSLSSRYDIFVKKFELYEGEIIVELEFRPKESLLKNWKGIIIKYLIISSKHGPIISFELNSKLYIG